MGEFITLGPADEISEGAAKAYPVEGSSIGVARIDGRLLAFSEICTHQRCNLVSGGEIDGTEITCECHGSVFDMATGEVVEGPAQDSLDIYPAREENGQIQIEV